MGGGTGTGWAGVNYRTLQEIGIKTERRPVPAVAFISQGEKEFAVVGEPAYIADVWKKLTERGIRGNVFNIYQ